MRTTQGSQGAGGKPSVCIRLPPLDILLSTCVLIMSFVGCLPYQPANYSRQKAQQAVSAQHMLVY